ncbi:hypothetical protein ACP70R_022732 [Stipagrostis hirtigluma subsp. patula]
MGVVHATSAALLFVLVAAAAFASPTTDSAAGGVAFAVPAAYALDILSQTSSNAWNLFGQTNAAQRKPIHAVTLVVVDQVDGGRPAAAHGDGRIDLSAAYMARHAGHLRNEVTGLLFQEVARVWMNDAGGSASPRLVDGIAELARLRAGYAPSSWAKAGEGTRWDQRRNGVAARFLDYLDQHRPGLVAELNSAALKEPAPSGDDLLQDITGHTTTELWEEYKAAYAA